jgi:hypothetical protein
MIYALKTAQGNNAANQYINTDARHNGVSGYMFESYGTAIAFKPNGNNPKILLDRDCWDYSATTGRYRNQFLNEGIAETRKKIANGTYVLAKLN